MSNSNIRILKDTNMIKFTFCCKFWVYSLRTTLFGRFRWYLWSVTSYRWFWRYYFVTRLLWPRIKNALGMNFRPPHHWILPVWVSLFLLLRVTVRPSDALIMHKSKSKQKGRISPHVVWAISSPKHNLCQLGEIRPPGKFTFHFV